MPNYFIDSHCHMFTIADIPLCRSIEQVLGNNDSPTTYLAFPLIPFIRPFYNPKKALEHYGPYIRFFESEPQQVVHQLASQAASGVTAISLKGVIEPVEQVVMTPLIMDFDAGAHVNKLEGQADRLKAAIASACVSLPGNVKILPFLGLNPVRNNITQLLAAYNVKPVSTRGGIDATANGDFVGIKLYPPLGFDVYPENNSALMAQYMSLYSQFAQRGIPVTVHCQKGSFALVDKDTKEAFTSPMNWEAVFNELSVTDQNSFRINFAHFGGDDGVYQTIDFRDANDSDGKLVEQVFEKICENTWTYSIIRLLKKYPQTYSDIAAFDFENDEAMVCLLWILYLDAIGRFDTLGNNKLVDKLLWGSDYPMILNSDVNNYELLLNKFIDSFTFATKYVGKFEYPPFAQLLAANQLSQKDFIKKLVCDNPRKFLF
jgi:hypothetical protein